MDARDWRFPMACPNCSAVAGTPYRADTARITLTLAMRCADCRNEWEISAPPPTMFLKARPDRRKSASERSLLSASAKGSHPV